MVIEERPLLIGVLEDRNSLLAGCWSRTLTGRRASLLQPLRTYLFMDLPEEVNLVGQSFQARLEFHLVHVCFIHILRVR